MQDVSVIVGLEIDKKITFVGTRKAIITRVIKSRLSDIFLNPARIEIIHKGKDIAILFDLLKPVPVSDKIFGNKIINTCLEIDFFIGVPYAVSVITKPAQDGSVVVYDNRQKA